MWSCAHESEMLAKVSSRSFITKVHHKKTTQAENPFVDSRSLSISRLAVDVSLTERLAAKILKGWPSRCLGYSWHCYVLDCQRRGSFADKRTLASRRQTGYDLCGVIRPPGEICSESQTALGAYFMRCVFNERHANISDNRCERGVDTAGVRAGAREQSEQARSYPGF